VNAALLGLYTGSGNNVISLSASVQAALKTLPNPKLPLLVAGHSLGGPMSTFAALDIYANVSNYAGTIQLYTFASLHVGDQSFATAFNGTTITCYRFANLSDFVPSLTGLSADTTVDPYVHVGLPCTFVWQTWEDWGNHSMANVYQPTIDKHWTVIQYGDLNYPASVQQ
jgi:triacylglycerol lipase